MGTTRNDEQHDFLTDYLTSLLLVKVIEMVISYYLPEGADNSVSGQWTEHGYY